MPESCHLSSIIEHTPSMDHHPSWDAAQLLAIHPTLDTPMSLVVNEIESCKLTSRDTLCKFNLNLYWVGLVLWRMGSVFDFCVLWHIHKNSSITWYFCVIYYHITLYCGVDTLKSRQNGGLFLVYLCSHSLKYLSFGSDSDLAPIKHQATISVWTKSGIVFWLWVNILIK